MASNEDLSTIITVESDTKGLEALMDSKLESVKKVAQQKITKLKSLEKEVVAVLSDTFVSYQEEILSKHVRSQTLINSIVIQKITANSNKIGVTATSKDGFPYGTVLENGRGAVFPVEKKCLHWYDNGDVFAMRSAPVKPDPFVKPSREKLKNEVKRITGLELQEL